MRNVSRWMFVYIDCGNNFYFLAISNLIEIFVNLTKNVSLINISYYKNNYAISEIFEVYSKGWIHCQTKLKLTGLLERNMRLNCWDWLTIAIFCIKEIITDFLLWRYREVNVVLIILWCDLVWMMEWFTLNL